MKKVLLAAMIAIAMVIATSCNNKAKEPGHSTKATIVDMANEALRGWAYKNIASQDGFSVRNKEIAYKDSNMCVIIIDAIMENQFGGHTKVKCQYTIYKYADGNWYEAMSVCQPNDYDGWWIKYEYESKEAGYWAKQKELMNTSCQYGNQERCKFSTPTQF